MMLKKHNLLIILSILIQETLTKDLNNICFGLNTEEISLKLEINELDTEEFSFNIDLKIKSKKDTSLKFKKCIDNKKSSKDFNSPEAPKVLQTSTKHNEEFVCSKKYENEICLTRKMLAMLINDPLALWEIKLIGKKIVVKKN
jgi:hypothetical protein